MASVHHQICQQHTSSSVSAEDSRNDGDYLSEDPFPARLSHFSTFQTSDTPVSARSEENLLQRPDSALSGSTATTPSLKPSRTFASTVVMILAAYATVFSALWLVVACVRPHYGNFVANNGTLAPDTASTISTGLAKTIELSSITIFVTTVGRFLTRKALDKKGTGISLADVQLRQVIMQPGILITEYSHISHIWRSFLGMLAIVACCSAAFYTTASDALVNPTPSMSPPSLQNLFGLVHSSFANDTYISGRCAMPISPEIDANSAQICMAFSFAGSGFNDISQWLSSWASTSVSQIQRPVPQSTFDDGGIVLGSWTSSQPVQSFNTQFNRTVNNVTLSMPHPGVYTSAVNKNSNKAVELAVQASVVSPTVHVLCASVTAAELEPLIYNQWQNFNSNNNTWLQNYTLNVPPDFGNKTAFDGLFGFGASRPPPVFPLIPTPRNMVLNTSAQSSADALYLLATDDNNMTMLCSMSATVEPGCSTKLTTAGGAKLSVACNSSDLDFQGNEATGIRSKSWAYHAAYWALSISLDSGITEGNSSITRLLTGLMPAGKDSNNPQGPTIAEALAVSSGSMLMNSMRDAPFDGIWNGTSVTQPFPVSFSMADYSSGPKASWQGIFYVVLATIFLLNLCCFTYLVATLNARGEIVDLTEPQNLFALAINSQCSRMRVASRETKGSKELLRVKWHVVDDRAKGGYISEDIVAPASSSRYARADHFDRLRKGTETSSQRTWSQSSFRYSHARQRSDLSF